ncbi:hypothetical protein ACVIW0_001733 [Bradyrhizobium sp. USDA 4454]
MSPIAAVGVLCWLYAPQRHRPPGGDGSGFRWLAVYPLGMVFGLFFLPPWLLVPSAGCRVARLGAWSRSLCLWSQLLQEFPLALH